MSVNSLNTFLNIRDAHLRVVSGNVHATAMNIGGINVDVAHGLQSVTNQGNVTSNTLQFSNATTAFVTTANVTVGRDLTVTGNALVSSNLTVTGNVTVSDDLTVTENLFVSNNLTVTKDVTVTGNTFYTNPMSISVDSNVVAEYTGPHDRPLRKYPEVALTANSDKGYVVSGSTRLDATGNYEYYKAFDNVISTGTTNWISASSTFDGSGDPTGTSNTFPGTSYRGEYCALKLPNAIKLDNFHIFPRGDASSFAYSNPPKDLRLFGSNDGTTWTHIKQFQNLSFTGLGGLRLHVNDSNTYNEYAFFVEKITVSSGGATYCAIGELELYGHEEGDSSLDTTLKSVYNVPGTQQLEVYYDGQDYTQASDFAGTNGVVDKVGGDQDGTAGTGVTFDSTYKAFTFDGTANGQILGTHGLGTGDVVYTMSYWFKRVAVVGTFDYLVNVGQGGTNRETVVMYINSNYLSLDYWNASLRVPELIILDKWYHVVAGHRGGVTPSNTNDFIYLNGKLITPIITQAAGAFDLQGTTLSLGTYRTGSSPSNSNIANFRLFSKALNAGQVQELYDYQKDYFLGSKSQVTLYKGHLGIGVAEPSGQLELAGDERIQEYPPRGLTVLDYHTHIEGHGEFEFYSSQGTWVSSYLGNASWDFTRVFTPRFTGDGGWHGDTVAVPGTYQVVAVYAPAVTSGDGFIQSTLKDGSAVLGDWIEMRTPYAINVTRIATAPRISYGNSRGMGKFAILGSNNGTDWEYAGNGAIAPHDISSSTDAGGYGTKGSETIAHVSTNSNGYYYTYHRLVVTHIMGHRGASGHSQYISGAGESVNQSYLRFLGTPGPTTLDKGSLTLGRSLDVPRISRYDVDTETPRPEKLLLDFDTTVNSSPTDISGQGGHGVFVNGASYSAADKAFDFDGTNDAILGIISNPAGDWVHSISFWFKLDIDQSTISTVKTENRIQPFQIARQGTGGVSRTSDLPSADLAGHVSGLDVVDSTFNWYFYGNDASFPISGIKANEWHHLTLAYEGGGAAANRHCFLDGVEYLNTGASTANLNVFANSILAIGKDHARTSSSPSYFPGQISNFKIYNVALEASEVQKLYRLGRTGRSMVISDTAVGIGKVPEAQLDVRGTFRAPGTIVQVEQTVKTNTSAVTSTSVVDIEYLSVDITPKFSTSKILVSYIVNVGVDITGTSNCHGFLRVKRTQGGTSTYIGDGASSGNRQACTSYIYNTVPNACDPFSFEHLDDANGTGTVTYTIQGLVEHSVYTMTINRSGSDGNNGYYGRTTSSITAKEVCQ